MEQAQRQIWQRVLARPDRDDPSPLGQLAYLSRESAGVYRGLLQEARGTQRRLLQQLLEGEEENQACLRGLGKLQGITVPEKAHGIPRQLGWKDLRQCADRTYCLLQEYTARSAMGASGAVFRQMAARQEKCCALLAALLGRLDR